MLKPYLVKGKQASQSVYGRSPIRSSNRQMEALLKSVPPPTGGWNTLDALDEMKPQDAVKLNNWYPRTSDVVTRPGYSLHCDTGEGAHDVRTVMALQHLGISKMLVACHGKLINTTTSSPSTVGSGFGSDIWQWVQFKGKIFMANGTDAPQDWDGTTLTATAWTGPTVANLIQPYAFKQRLFFVQKNSTSFWYTALTGAVTGALTEFSVADNLAQGGNIKLLCKITRDGGEGPDDLFVIVMTTGYAIVYQGTDPGDAQSWSLVGNFFVGEPVAIRGVVEVGSDTVLVTKLGYVPLTTIFTLGRAIKLRDTISDKISGAATDATSRYGDNVNWGPIIHSEQNMLIINVPRSSTICDQHIMNLNTNAWSKFVDIPAYCWGIWAGNPYFGGLGDGKVYAFDGGAVDDNGVSISCDAQVAWNYMGNRENFKNFLMARTIFSGVYLPTIQINAGADFEDIAVGPNVIPAQGAAGTPWGNPSQWNLVQWGGTLQTYARWIGVNASGYCVSLRVTMDASLAQVSWLSTTYSYERGGML